LDVPVPDYVASLEGRSPEGRAQGLPLHGLRVALLRPFVDGCDPGVAAAVEATLGVFTALGAEMVEVEAPSPMETRAALSVIISAEATAFHDPMLRERAAEYGADVRERLQSGYALSAIDYVAAQRVRASLVER